jgi:hypothetical protein
MAKQQSQGKKGSRKIGRNLKKCAHYAAMHTRETNKIKRILHSNGLIYATEWAGKHGVLGYLRNLAKEA